MGEDLPRRKAEERVVTVIINSFLKETDRTEG